MKPRSIGPGRLLLAMLLIGTIFILVSWNHKPSIGGFHREQYFTDTPQKGKKIEGEKKVRNLDDVLNELNGIDIQKEMQKANKDVEEAMKELDGEKIKMEIDKAMKEVDFKKMQKELTESIAKLDIDMVKMKKELAESLNKVDADEMKQEIEKAMKEVDVAKIQKDAQEQIAKIDWEKMKMQMDELKKIDMAKVEQEMEKAKKDMEKIGPQVEKEMQKAKVEIEKAKQEMKEYKMFVDGLDKDGLIKKDAPYTITLKNGELIINGKKASDATYLKYRNFLDKHPKFDIKKTGDDFDLDVD